METFKEKRIRIMANYSFGCTVENLPANVTCQYRADTYGEICKHILAHQKSLNNKQRTKARYFEVEENLTIQQE